MNYLKLKDICLIINGFAFKSEDYTESGFRIIRISNVQKGYIEDSSPVFYSENSPIIEKYRLYEGDLLISLTGNVGRAALIDKELLPAVLNQRVACLRMKSNQVTKEYLFHLLNSDLFERQCVIASNGVAQKNLSTEWLKEYRVPVPSLENQKHITKKLDSVNFIISRFKQKLVGFDNLIKARFVEMFGDPETNPKCWKKGPLADVITTANNGMARRGNDEDGNIVMRLVELQDGYIDYSRPNRIVLTDKEKKRYLLKDKDFLFARVNGNPENVGRCAVFYDIGEPVFHNDHIIRVHFDDSVLEGPFASALLNSEYGKRQLRNQIKTSAGQYTVSQDGIGAIVAILPPIEAQRQFASFVAQVDKSKVVEQPKLS